MKKSTKIWLIVAAALCGAGILLLGAAWAMVGLGFKPTEMPVYEVNTSELTGEFTRISIVTGTADVILVPTDEDNCRVECRETNKVYHIVSVMEGTLLIEMVDQRAWYEHIYFGFESPRVTVYLPKREYDTLSVTVDTGDTEIPADFTFASVRVDGGTGNVNCRADVNDRADISVTTGDINIDGGIAGNIRCKTSTGHINLNRVTCSGDLDLNVSSGKLTLTDVTCRSISTDGNTGDVRFRNVLASVSLTVERSTGDVTLESCDAPTIRLETSTGNISASLRSAKIFSVHSDNGVTRVPKNGSEGSFIANASTGDIRVEVVP